MLSPESSIAFYIGDFGVRFYSVIMFIAIICGFWLSCLIAKKYYKVVKTEVMWDMLPIIVISALIGARLYYVLLDWSFFSQNLSEIFAVYHGGLSIHGAILGGLIGAFSYTKKNNLDFLYYIDVFSYGIIFGQIIGRLGNYFNIEAFGKVCNLPQWLCLYVPQAKRPIGYDDILYYYPTFLYEMIWNAFVLLLMLFVVGKYANNKSGVAFFAYLALYSLGRMIIEPFRMDSVLNIGGIHFAEIMSILIFIFALVMLLVRVGKIPFKVQ